MEQVKGKLQNNARFGKGGFGQGRNANAKNNQNKKKQPQSHNQTRAKNNNAEQEKYVVVITNVENDFAKIHQHCLPLYLGLDASPGSSGTEEGEVKKPCCTYQLKCRTETRTAQLSVSGAANADIGTIFSRAHSSKNHKTSGSPHGASAAATPSETAVDEHSSAIDPTAVAAEESEEQPPLAEIQEDLRHSSSSSSAAATSLEGRIATLQRQPYFGQYLHFDVHIPGKEEGAVLHQGHRKRPREEDGGDAHAHTDGDEANPAVDTTKAKNSKNDFGAVKQSTRNQSDLVTAVAVVTSSWATKELRQRLKDLPGFMSLWFLYSRHFRILFSTAAALFRAKKLLDEFEIEGKVRVNIQLSDNLQRRYEEYLSAENDELMTASPLLSLGSGAE